MSYVVLARKYRPRSFEQMVGQDHVVRALTHALQQGRLHHAYLFTGTRGIGKTTVSRILAKSLNCTGPDGRGGITAQPCGQCTACREIDADRYIDYIELDAASNRSIDEVRDLIERAAYKPSVGRFKVFMIDEAHQLTRDAFNALLKTLEEPPEYLKFVLATTDPEKMLPTVLSRCLQFNLRPMAPQTVAEHLGRVLNAEAVPVEAGALQLLSRAARGSMRDALSLTDQAIAFGGGQLQEAAVRAMLGAVDRRHARRLISALAARDGAGVVAQAEDLRAQGLAAQGTLEEIARLLQQMAVCQLAPKSVDPQDEDMAVAVELAPLLAPDETQLLYSMVLQGRAELALAPDEYSGLVMALLRFLAFGPGSESRDPSSPVPSSTPSFNPSSAPVASAGGSGQAFGSVKNESRGAALSSLAGLPPPTSQGLGSASITAQAAPNAASAASSPRPAAQRDVLLPSSKPAPPAQVAVAPLAAARPEPAKPPSHPEADEPPPWMDEAPPAEDLAFEAPPAAAGRSRRFISSDLGVEARPQAGSTRTERLGSAPVLVADEASDAAADPFERQNNNEAELGAVRSKPHAGHVAQEFDKAVDPSFPEPEFSSPAGSAEIRLPQPPAGPARLQRTALGDRWYDLIQPLLQSGAISALVRELAVQSELVAVDDTRQPALWRLRLERDTLRNPALAEKLQAALSGIGQALELGLEAGSVSDTISMREVEAAQVRQREAEELIRNDPLVVNLLSRIPGARLVPGTIRPL